MRRVVLTGGPGAGKSTVLDQLRAEGLATAEDAARAIIQARKAMGLSPRPEAGAFAREILDRDIAAYDSATSSPTFFERGVPDAVGMLLASGGLDEQGGREFVKRYPYHQQVFLFPPWQEIYRTDAERDHTFEHAVTVYEATRDWYIRLDYEVVEVPQASVEARAEFILYTIGRRR